jgi:hypothetical protein
MRKWFLRVKRGYPVPTREAIAGAVGAHTWYRDGQRERTDRRAKTSREQKAKIMLDIANKKRNTLAVLRGGLCLQFSPFRPWVFVPSVAPFHQPQQDSFLIAQKT